MPEAFEEMKHADHSGTVGEILNSLVDLIRRNISKRDIRFGEQFIFPVFYRYKFGFFSPDMIEALVDDDPPEPGSQRTLTAERGQLPEHPDESLLQQVFSFGSFGYHSQAKVVHAAGVLLVQAVLGHAVAPDARSYEFLVYIRDVRGQLPSVYRKDTLDRGKLEPKVKTFSDQKPGHGLKQVIKGSFLNW
jgi:hypothetical protein